MAEMCCGSAGILCRQSVKNVFSWFLWVLLCTTFSILTTSSAKNNDIYLINTKISAGILHAVLLWKQGQGEAALGRCWGVENSRDREKPKEPWKRTSTTGNVRNSGNTRVSTPLWRTPAQLSNPTRVWWGAWFGESIQQGCAEFWLPPAETRPTGPEARANRTFEESGDRGWGLGWRHEQQWPPHINQYLSCCLNTVRLSRPQEAIVHICEILRRVPLVLDHTQFRCPLQSLQ